MKEHLLNDTVSAAIHPNILQTQEQRYEECISVPETPKQIQFEKIILSPQKRSIKLVPPFVRGGQTPIIPQFIKGSQTPLKLEHLSKTPVNTMNLEQKV